MRSILLFLLVFISVGSYCYSQAISYIDIVGPSSVTAGQQTTYTINFYSGSGQIAPPTSGSYYWDTNGATASGNAISYNYLTWPSSGTFSIYYEYSDVTGTFYDYLTVTVTGSTTDLCPLVIPSAPGATLIANGQVTLSANPAPVGFTYQWYDSNQTTLLASTQNYTTPILSASKTYYVAYRYTSTGCITSKMPVRINRYSEDQNWTREYSARDTLTGDYTLRNSSQKLSYKQTSYHDGLGRPNQQVTIQASVNGSDIITPVGYDALGRQYRDYLPFPDNSTSQGLYRSTATTLHNSYYTAQYADSRGYSDKSFETSPLNRVLKQGVVGTPWIGHEIEFFENVNTAADSVRIWTVNSSGLPVNGGLFANGALSKVESYNEQDQRTIEYKDKLGRLILKKVQIDLAPTSHHDGWLCSYYVYDLMGNLRVVMPPKAISTLRASNNWAGSISDSNKFGLYYLYSYDVKGRQITKKLPGKAPEEMVYDLQDRLVASHDSLLISQGKWLFAKYDVLGREVMTGLVTYSGTRATLQTLVDGLGNNNAVINSTSGKTGTTNAGGFPRATDGNGEGDVLTVNYYDNYSFRKSTLTYVKPTGYHDSSTKTTGMLTGTLVKNLGNNTRYETAIYYDSQGRVIQTISDHHLAGTVRISSKYDFENKPLETITQHTTPGTYTITKGYVYNAAGGLSHINHKINSGGVVTLATHTYNQLGELTSKAYPVAGAALTSFTYNIRGWLKKINDPQVSNATTGVFAQELFYEAGGGFNQFGGSIAKAEWKGKDNSKRVYNYYYDMNNRLADVLYTVPGSPSEDGRYNIGYVSYDANGNLMSLWRLNERSLGSFGVVDQLTYTYAVNSNKLLNVADPEPTNFVSKDFKNLGTTNYTYNSNGNLTSNSDKSITSITYNHLNLPATITFSGTNKKIDYWYDAQGVKLRQVNTDGATVKTFDYLGEIVFENNAISYIMHEEGRASYENSAFQYEFFVKDHLGNVRQVIRAPVSVFRVATMEPENTQEEEKYFENISESRQGAGEHNKTPGGYATAWLNAARNRILGPSRSQEVQQGDSVTLEVFGKYVDPKKIRLSPASFVRSGMDKRMIRHLTEYGQNLSAGGVNEIAIANVVALVITELQQKPVPEAYMAYALYDSDSTLYDQGKVTLSRRARNKHEELTKKIAVSKDGYIETYLVNETSDDVWFDQFSVTSTGPLIVQETHYDPWGVELSGLGYQYGGIKVNPYLYNGKEANGHLGVNMYDFGARMYDPAIGRWFVMDPMAEQMHRHSPYNYAYNNPMRFIDPDGMAPVTINQGTATHSDSEDNTQNEVATGKVGEEQYDKRLNNIVRRALIQRSDFQWSDGYGNQSARFSTTSMGSHFGEYSVSKNKNSLAGYDGNDHPGVLNLKNQGREAIAVHLLKGIKYHMTSKTDIDLNGLFECLSTECLGIGGTHLESKKPQHMLNSFLGPSGDSFAPFQMGNREVNMLYQIPFHGPERGLSFKYFDYQDGYHENGNWYIRWGGTSGLYLNFKNNQEFMKNWILGK
ncbi:DUF6443 domain-containing protein [uncultured Algoriphagus sp.]|uniref:DUF6443 domain-containing protein n=1 Tax=uncultured Algoriphagus sp. TaxID=417365 RepID=UPI0030EC9E74|tara:strand:- start:6150 stop:10721 length:4572 start_codon:yes stop_codon:yes gene_type:complete